MYADYELDEDSDCSDCILDEFVVLEAPKEPPCELDCFMNVSAYLSEVLSSDSEIDPRVCCKCMESLTAMMEERLKEIQDECQNHKHYLEKLETEPFLEDLDQMQKELENLILEEEDLKFNLSLAKEQECKINLELEAEMELNKKLVEEELKYSKVFYKHLHGYHTTEEELISLKHQLAYTKRKNQQLKRLNLIAVVK